jgi:hypothetical protein
MTKPPTLHWFKSSYSGGSGSDCVEVAGDPAGRQTLVRDSKDPQGPVLTFDAAAFASFVDAARSGQFDI